MDKSIRREIFSSGQGLKTQEYFVYFKFPHPIEKSLPLRFPCAGEGRPAAQGDYFQYNTDFMQRQGFFLRNGFFVEHGNCAPEGGGKVVKI